jgi:hypothetical protein
MALAQKNKKNVKSENSRLFYSETGKRVLEVRYFGDKFDSAIKNALKHYDLSATDVQIIALPDSFFNE